VVGQLCAEGGASVASEGLKTERMIEFSLGHDLVIEALDEVDGPHDTAAGLPSMVFALHHSGEGVAAYEQEAAFLFDHFLILHFSVLIYF
jgi:hypothetical protein